MKNRLLSIPGSEKYFSDGSPVRPEEVHPSLRLFRSRLLPEVDAITFEVIAHKLWQINDEQGQTLKRISGSPVATDANDFNVVICDPLGEIVNIGAYLLIHASNLDFMIKWTLRHRSDNPGIGPDDMFLCNDPWVGALHPQDVVVLSPIFVGDALFCWTGSTIHQVDVGGVNVGSWCVDADDHFAEGMAYPPIKIVEAGEIRRDVEEAYLRRTRAPGLLGLDLRAHIASNNVAKERFVSLVERYGADVVQAVMQGLMNHAEERFRARLLEIPDGVWRHETYQEAARSGDRGVYQTVLSVTKEGDRLTLDYTGTAENVGMINSTRAGAIGGSMVGILPMLCYDIPWALGGIHRAIDFITPPGSIVNAEFPHGVSMGSVSGTKSCINAVTVCVAKMLSSVPHLTERLIGACCGAWTTVIASGLNVEDKPFVTMITDCMAGGWGARSHGDGVDTGGVMSAITGQCPNVETNEAFYPILYLYRREDIDSGGPGRFRGGMGGTSCWIPYAPHDPGRGINLVLATFGQAFPVATGINGGYPANASKFRIRRATDVYEWFSRGEMPTDIEALNGQLDHLHPKDEIFQGPSDVFEHTWSGGGGFGDPLERAPELVARDVVLGAVSAEVGREVYGVVTAAGKVDVAATETTRWAIRRRRISAEAVRAPVARKAEDRVADHLLVSGDGTIQCARCSESLGPMCQNYKLSAVRRDWPVEVANPHLVSPAEFVDVEMTFRGFFCPGCGACLETEVVTAMTEPIHDKSLAGKAH